MRPLSRNYRARMSFFSPCAGPPVVFHVRLPARLIANPPSFQLTYTNILMSRG